MPVTIKKFDVPGVGEVEIYTEWTDVADRPSELCVEFPGCAPDRWMDDLSEFVSLKLPWAEDVGFDSSDRFSIYVGEIQSFYAWELEEALLQFAKEINDA